MNVYQPAFPVAVQPAAADFLHAMDSLIEHPPWQGFQVTVAGELLSAPYRIHCHISDLRNLIEHSEGHARMLGLCLGTRHCNGYFRDECVRKLLPSVPLWVAPFIIQLLGEYVIEIVDVIGAWVGEENPQILRQFALENPSFMATTRRRATSYWDCYYRESTPLLADYAAIKVLDAIRRSAVLPSVQMAP